MFSENINNNFIRIPDRERLALTARILSGESFATIGRDFGMSERTVESIKRKRQWYRDYRELIVKQGYDSLTQNM